MSRPDASRPGAGRSDGAGDGSIRPYLAVLAVAVALAIGLAVYLVGYRAEIMAILTQSPT